MTVVASPSNIPLPMSPHWEEALLLAGDSSQGTGGYRNETLRKRVKGSSYDPSIMAVKNYVYPSLKTISPRSRYINNRIVYYPESNVVDYIPIIRLRNASKPPSVFFLFNKRKGHLRNLTTMRDEDSVPLISLQETLLENKNSYPLMIDSLQQDLRDKNFWTNLMKFPEWYLREESPKKSEEESKENHHIVPKGVIIASVLRHVLSSSWMENGRMVKEFPFEKTASGEKAAIGYSSDFYNKIGQVGSYLIQSSLGNDDPSIPVLLPFLDAFEPTIMDILTVRSVPTPEYLLDKVVNNIITMKSYGPQSELSKRATPLKNQLLDGPNTSFWDKFAMSDNADLQKSALKNIVNKTYDLEKKKNVMNFIFQPGKNKKVIAGRRKRLVDAYDTWESPTDCDIIGKLVDDDDATVSNTATILMREKCPEIYLDGKIEVAKAGNIGAITDAFKEMIEIYPLFTHQDKIKTFIEKAFSRKEMQEEFTDAMKNVGFNDCKLLEEMEDAPGIGSAVKKAMELIKCVH